MALINESIWEMGVETGEGFDLGGAVLRRIGGLVANAAGRNLFRGIVLVAGRTFVAFGRADVGEGAFLAGFQQAAGIVTVTGLLFLPANSLGAGIVRRDGGKRAVVTRRAAPALTPLARIEKAALGAGKRVLGFAGRGSQTFGRRLLAGLVAGDGEDRALLA
jgi:hypothetical protein